MGGRTFVGVLNSVVVRRAAQVDTLTGIQVGREPLVANAMVTGLSYEGASATAGFIFDADTRALSRIELPEDFSAWSVWSISPDGSAFAYIARARPDRFKLVVRTWPDLNFLAESSAVPGYPSDVEYNSVDWSSERSFEAFIRTGLDGYPFLRVCGSTALPSLSQDTIPFAEQIESTERCSASGA